MPHALSALLHYLPRLSRRLHPHRPPRPPSRLVEPFTRTKQSGSARPVPSIFPVMGRSDVHRAASGAMLKKNWREGGRRKNHYGVFPAVSFSCWVAALTACDPSLSSSQSPSFHLACSASVALRPLPPSSPPSHLPSLLPLTSLPPSGRPSVCLLAAAASLSIIVKPRSVHFLPSLMALR